MDFEHADEIWRDFPELVPGVIAAGGITPDADVAEPVAGYTKVAMDRLAAAPESEFPEIQAWRRAFGRFGVRPTQYRCASEALLRRLRREGTLPSLHPLVDLCNAISAAFATPIAVLDVDQIGGDLQVRYATGDERYLTFGGEVEYPAPGEVIYADSAGQAHARRWTNRQSGASAVRESTSSVLIVAEALHGTAPADMPRLVAAVTTELTAAWPALQPSPSPTSRS
ncbi:MAG TPA: phenylalanine--tRNA ligase beta subunit-related protein [Streptosporangiaceae bacterium]|nr:phenylalanine--tRNA ligase beta subunit-related protein [Streptosporangiaceae bacterium]